MDTLHKGDDDDDNKFQLIGWNYLNNALNALNMNNIMNL